MHKQKEGGREGGREGVPGAHEDVIQDAEDELVLHRQGLVVHEPVEGHHALVLGHLGGGGEEGREEGKEGGEPCW